MKGGVSHQSSLDQGAVPFFARGELWLVWPNGRLSKSGCWDVRCSKRNYISKVMKDPPGFWQGVLLEEQEPSQDLAGSSREGISAFYASVAKFVSLAEARKDCFFPPWIWAIYPHFLASQSSSGGITSRAAGSAATPLAVGRSQWEQW